MDNCDTRNLDNLKETRLISVHLLRVVRDKWGSDGVSKISRGLIHGGVERRGGATYEISGGSVLTLPVRMDKGV